MKKYLALILAIMLVFSLCAVSANAADVVTVTPNSTVGGETLVLTATGLQDDFATYQIFGLTEYCLWLAGDGTFSFNIDVSLDNAGAHFADLKAGEVCNIADGYNGCYLYLDDGTVLVLLDKDNPGMYAAVIADTPLSEFPGTIAMPGAAAPAEEEPAAEEPAAEEPAAEEPAAEEPAAAAEDAVVYVTISVAGEVVAPSVPVLVSDLDADGAFNVDEVLTCAHDQLYPGGAEAGYASSYGDWGLGMGRHLLRFRLLR